MLKVLGTLCWLLARAAWLGALDRARPLVTRIAALYTRFNERLALMITAGVSTMECAYIFSFLAILGFPGTGATATQYVQWVSQTFIQLTMLSVLSVQQKINADQQAAHHVAITQLHSDHAAEIAAIHVKIDHLFEGKAATA